VYFEVHNSCITNPQGRILDPGETLEIQAELQDEPKPVAKANN